MRRGKGKSSHFSKKKQLIWSQPWDDSDVGIIKDSKAAIITVLRQIQLSSWNRWRDRCSQREIETLKEPNASFDIKYTTLEIKISLDTPRMKITNNNNEKANKAESWTCE